MLDMSRLTQRIAHLSNDELTVEEGSVYPGHCLVVRHADFVRLGR